MFEGSVTIRSSSPARSMAARVRARRPAYSSRVKGRSTALMVLSLLAVAPAEPLPASVGPGGSAAPPPDPPSGPAGRSVHALSVGPGRSAAPPPDPPSGPAGRSVHVLSVGPGG